MEQSKQKHEQSLKGSQIILTSQQTFNNNFHDLSTLKVSKIALSSGNDKRIQIFICVK